MTETETSILANAEGNDNKQVKESYINYNEEKGENYILQNDEGEENQKNNVLEENEDADNNDNTIQINDELENINQDEPDHQQMIPTIKIQEITSDEIVNETNIIDKLDKEADKPVKITDIYNKYDNLTDEDIVERVKQKK